MSSPAAADLATCPRSGAPGPARLTVAQLAAAIGVRPDTIRYYERAGLLPPPPRTPAQHRRYDDTAVDRLRFVRGAQRLGLRLREIKTLLQVRDVGTCPCAPAEVLLREHIGEIDRELARLASLRVELTRIVDALPTGPCPDPLPGTWLPERR